jgi:hypothetical protein
MDSPVDFEPDDHGIRLRLSAQRALWGNIPTSLRAVSVEYDGHLIRCRYVFDGAPSAFDRDLLAQAGTEIISDYSSPYSVDEEFIVLPEPAPISHLKHLVFMRYEAATSA